MFEEIIDFIDYKVLGISLVLSLIFIFMVWGLPTWKDYPVERKILITIILPIVSYIIVLFQTNR